MDDLYLCFALMEIRARIRVSPPSCLLASLSAESVRNHGQFQNPTLSPDIPLGYVGIQVLSACQGILITAHVASTPLKRCLKLFSARIAPIIQSSVSLMNVVIVAHICVVELLDDGSSFFSSPVQINDACPQICYSQV